MRYMILIATSILFACSAETGANSTISRDSAGVRIVENPAPAPALNWHLHTEPTVQIGGADVGESYELHSASDAARLSDGRIVIGNNGTQELRFFSADGVFLQSAGRRGEGPGEFKSIWWMEVMAGDSLYVFDRHLRRLSVFDGGGGFVRSIRIKSTSDFPLSWPVGVFSDRSMLSHGYAITGGVTPEGLQRFGIPMYHLDADGMPVREVGVFSGAETYHKAFDRGFALHEAVFPRTTHIVVGRDIFYVATGDTYEIQTFSPEGMLLTIVRRDQRPAAVTSEHLRAERERRLANARPESRQHQSRIFDETPKPQTFPAYHHIVVDDLRHVWVQEYPMPGATAPRWSVFNSAGALLGDVLVPPGARITHIGDDFLLGIWKNELDVELVRMYALDKHD